jgi:hypothetical protein
VPAGEPVDIDLVLENVSAREVNLWLRPADTDFRVSATFEEKKEVPPTAYADRLRRERGLTGVPRTMTKLKPGESVAATVRASRLCDMTVEGSYLIDITFIPSEPDPREFSLTGNQVRIDVTSPDTGNAIPGRPDERHERK